MCRGTWGQTEMPGPLCVERSLTTEFQAGGNEPPRERALSVTRGSCNKQVSGDGHWVSGGDAGRQRLGGERVVRQGQSPEEEAGAGGWGPHCSWAGAGQALVPEESAGGSRCGRGWCGHRSCSQGPSDVVPGHQDAVREGEEHVPHCCLCPPLKRTFLPQLEIVH